MDNITATKIDENTIEVIKTVPVEVLPAVTYDYGFLLKQKEDIIRQRDEYVGARNKEIAEVDSLLAECTRLGVIEKLEVPVETPVKELPVEPVLLVEEPIIK